MRDVRPEPVRSAHHARAQDTPTHHPLRHDANRQPGTASPPNVEALIAQLQREFPNAHIRITGRGRTVRRQAELMADRRRANRQQFLDTYVPAPHITEMDRWVTAHPTASAAEAASAFEEIIERARRNGAVVSNHLSDRARDISIPVGGPQVQNAVRQRLHELGAHVIDEHDAVGGPHWHVDY